MKKLTASDARNRFGELMDTVQREPVAIESHGRAVAVVLSAEDYRLLKLERLRAELEIGEGEAKRGEYVDSDVEQFLREEHERESKEDQNKKAI